MTDTLIRVESLSKKFCRSLKKSLLYGMQDLGRELLGRRHGGDGQLRDGEFWAVRDAHFELARGESLGLIGHNGAGKTTLLRLLNGLIKPDAGRIEIRGRVGALIALGAGFNPLLSGRENIYINASVLGLRTREIDGKLDAIIDFAELEEFIDAPVQSYSSGMHVRLGFAIAAHLNPDVMLVDEALAVGDARFQKKCFDRIQFMQSQGTAFVVVSHNPYQIESLCQKVAVMHKGAMPTVAEGKQALTLYHDLVQNDLRSARTHNSSTRNGTGELIVRRFKVEDAAGTSRDCYDTMDTIRLLAELEAAVPVRGVRIRFEICSASNAVVIMAASNGISEDLSFEGTQTAALVISPCQLTSGWYYVNVVVTNSSSVRLDTWQRAAEFKVAQTSEHGRRFSGDLGVFVCKGQWKFTA